MRWCGVGGTVDIVGFVMVVCFVVGWVYCGVWGVGWVVAIGVGVDWGSGVMVVIDGSMLRVGGWGGGVFDVVEVVVAPYCLLPS